MLAAANSAAVNAAATLLGMARNMSSFLYEWECSLALEGAPPTTAGPGLFRILQGFGGVVGESRALPALQGHVARMGPAFHAVDHVGQARAAFGQVGRVDLGDVAQAHHLGA